MTQPDHVGGAGARLQLDPVPGVALRGDLPVNLDGERAAGGQDLQCQAVVDREHQAAVVGRVRRGRGDQQALDRWADDGAASGEAVGGRTGRGGDHDGVGGVADERVPGGAHRDEGGRVPRVADDGDVVEGGDDLVTEHGVHREPRLDGEPVLVDGGQRVGQVGHVHLGQETQLAEVHAEYRGGLPVRQPHGAQHRAVSAEADQQVGTLAKLHRGHRHGGAVQPADFRFDAQNLGLVTRCPAQNGLHRFGGITLRVQHQADDVHQAPLSCDMGPSYSGSRRS